MSITDNAAPGLYFVEVDPLVSTLPNIPSDVCGMLGVTERGRYGPRLATDFNQWVNEYGGFTTDSLDTAIAAMGYFQNGGRTLYTVRIVHFTDITDITTRTSAAATIDIAAAAAATAGSVTTGNTEPFFLFAGGTVLVKEDGGGAQTVTWDAASGARTGAGGTFPTGFGGGETLILNIDNEPINRTITFTAAESTLADVVNFINTAGKLPGGSAEDSGSELKLTSDSKGTGSRMEVVGGTGAATLGMTVGATVGTGDVADIEAVTAAEVVSRIIADTTLTASEVTAVAGAVNIATPTLGAGGSIQIDAASTLDDSTYLDLDNSVHSGSDAGSGVMGTCDALSHGAWANGWKYIVSAASNGDSDYFDVELQDASSIRKRYWRDCITTVADPDYWQTKINTDSGNDYITVTDSLTGSPPANRPTDGTYTLASGDSGLTSLGNTDYSGSAAGPSGLYELDTVENLRTLIVPGKANSAVHNAMVTYCDTRRLRVVQCILDPPAAYTEAEIRTYVVTTASLKGSSETAWTYWPRMEVVNPRPAVITSDRVLGGVERIDVAMSGHIAGMWARGDNTVGGVYENHAGTEGGILRNVLGPESATLLSENKHEVDDARKRGLVYGDLINPVRKGSGGVYVDGTKMLKSDGNFPRLGQRRGASHIKRTIEVGLPWVPHKRIKKSLRDRIDRSVKRFLDGEVAIGAFESNDPALAYSWSIAESLNTPDVGAGYEVRARLGLAFANPADFMTIELYNDRYAYDEAVALAA